MNKNDAEVTVNQPSGQEDQRLVQIVEEYRALLEAGQKPERKPFLERYPDLAASLNDCFDGLEFVFNVAPDMRDHRAQRGSPDPVGSLRASADSVGTLPTAVLLGDYKVVREIGRGGMGVVYEAEQMLLGRRVALKVLPFAATMDARQLQRFQNEARAAACLHHPHIVPVYAVGCERGVHFYAMQFIDGQNLAGMIGESKKETEGRATPQAASSTIRDIKSSTQLSAGVPGYFHAAARLGVQAAQALDHAHQVGVLHRDIKPANLMVDGRGNVWITDFGLAQIQGDVQLTMTGDLVGTLRYMSPEQALAKRVLVDHRTDIYSLGATLYELLTLQPVFPGGDRQELLRQIAFEEPLTLRRHNKAIPAELETIVLKALEKNPADRYASAQELADDLERYVKDEPIKARRPSLWWQVRKWCRRHKPLVWSAAAAMILVALVLGGSIGYVVRDRADRMASIAQHVEVALGGARTAIEAGDLILARQRVVEAQTHLGSERESLPVLYADTERIQKEIDTRQDDLARLDQFLKLANDAQLQMNMTSQPNPKDLAKADDLANEVFSLYGVLKEGGWLAQLENSTLGADQKAQVRETVYITLVISAAWSSRLAQKTSKRLDHGLKLLERAQALHEPTRAFYFVRSECHRLRGNTTAAEEDLKQFREAPIRTAWDHFLPGHAAGLRGDIEEALRSYRLALAMKPDHFDSLFFLGQLLRSQTIYRLSEAIYAYTACIALRPDSLDSISYRGNCYYLLGHMEEALVDYNTAIALATKKGYKPIEYYYYYISRINIYTRLGLADKAREDRQKITAMDEGELAKSLAKFGPDDRSTLNAMNKLAGSYLAEGKQQEAIALFEQTLERRRAKFGPDDYGTFGAMSALARAYSDLGRVQDGIALYEQILEKSKAKFGPENSDTIGAMKSLAFAYRNAGRLQDAIELFKQALEREKGEFGPDLSSSPQFYVELAKTYQMAGELDQADRLFRDLLEHYRKTGWPYKLGTSSLLADFGLNLLKQQRFLEAEPLLRECLAIHNKQVPDTYRFFNALSLLGGALLGQKKYAAAEPLLLEGYDGMKKREITIPKDSMFRLTDAAERIVNLYEATEQNEKARAWRENLAALEKRAGEKR